MKNKYLIISLLTISWCFILLTGCNINKSDSFTLEEIKNDYSISQPIDEPREAIEVLKQNNQINYTYLNEIQSQVGREIKWKLYTKQNESIWSINLKTDGLVPPHICSYEMDRDGNPTQNKYLLECYWMK
ncbi:MAG: hypothetical protein M0Q92_08795 [Methanoregula sp.]|jgi:hypothetical protein|nr:hypothetical protein [Methanoregula sp.]